jgi:protein involved in polysaccharide export with SLBB domain
VRLRRSDCNIWRSSKFQSILTLFVITLLPICFNGCFERVRLPSDEQLTEFAQAGPVHPAIDLDQLVGARKGDGLYRVIPGDVLELTMPAILQVVLTKTLEAVANVSVYMCRVSEKGTITLPIVGEIDVTGRTLGQIESTIIDAYYPRYIGVRPSVLAQIAEYKTAKVSITGAVKNPGIYELRSDRMTLVALIMEASGIIDEGAACIKIKHADQVGSGQESLDPNSELAEHESSPEEITSVKSKKSEPIVLPIKGLNIPFADAALHNGDAVVVERLEMPLFTMIGLVNKPGNYPYPPDARYNLMQAIAFAGGLDQDADPRYATIYRLKADGTILRTPFRVIKPDNGSEMMDSLNVAVKPGDIVAIEHTPRTRTNLFLQRIFHVNVGAYVPVPILR